MKNINEITSELDEVIEKGNEVKKALTFDILKPTEMSEFQHFYSPYQLRTDGTYAPWPEDHWLQQKPSSERDPSFAAYRHKQDGFRETRAFYGDPEPIRQFRRSIDGIFAKGLPVGTIHKYEDGTQYRKEETDGVPHWVPVGVNEHQRKMHNPNSQSAHHEIERHAKTSKLEGHLKKRGIKIREKLAKEEEKKKNDELKAQGKEPKKSVDNATPKSKKSVKKGLEGFLKSLIESGVKVETIREAINGIEE